MSTSFPGFPKDDSKLVNKWWRFTGIGGDRVIASCITNNVGGTKHELYIPFTYPTNESTMENNMTAYSDNLNTCDQQLSARVSVAYCPGGFYVYKPLTHPHSDMAYVTCEWQLFFFFFKQPNQHGAEACCCHMMKKKRLGMNLLFWARRGTMT